MSQNIKAPVVYKWATSTKVMISDIGEDCENPIWIEQKTNKQYADRLDRDSDEYIARNIWEKQMRYEEIDRYPTTAALRYGV